MKKIVLESLLLLLPFLGFSQTAFTPGNIVISRVGAGNASLSSKAAPVYLTEITPSGTLVQIIPLPFENSALTGNNNKFVTQGSSSNDANITVSANGAFFVLTGYSTDTTTAVPSGSVNFKKINKVIARVSMNGVVNTSTLMDTATFTGSSTINARCATSNDGTGFWQVGSSGGVRYVPFGSTGSGTDTVTIVSNTVSNLRTIQTYGGDLIVGSASGTVVRVGKISGFPTTSGNTLTNLQGMSVFPSANSIFITSLPGGPTGLNTLYVADDGTNSGIKKFCLNATTGNWDSVGMYDAGGAYRGLTCSVNGSTVNIYAIKASTPLLRFVDVAGYGVAPTPKVAPYDTIYKATTNTAFRGVAIVPQSSTLAINLLSFNAVKTDDGKAKAWWIVSEDASVLNYTVEKSFNGTEFFSVGTVNASGKNNYSFSDPELLSKTSYYRVRFNQKDGKISYSNIVVVKSTVNIKLEAFPNPVISKLVVTYPETRVIAGITVTTIDGKQVKNIAVPIGSSQTQIDFSTLNKGNYIISFRDADNNHSSIQVTR